MGRLTLWNSATLHIDFLTLSTQKTLTAKLTAIQMGASLTSLVSFDSNTSLLNLYMRIVIDRTARYRVWSID